MTTVPPGCCSELIILSSNTIVFAVTEDTEEIPPNQYLIVLVPLTQIR